MLVIRMQRTGRKGHAMFRVVVQDSRRTPTSGKVVASLGSYDPHAKNAQLNKEKAAFYLEHGAQPSPRVAALLKSEGVKLPEWVSLPGARQGSVRFPEKRRSTAPAEEQPAEVPAEETPVESPAESAAEAAPAEPAGEEAAPAEEPAATEAEASAEESDEAAS